MAFPTIPTVAGGRVLVTTQANATSPRTFPNLSSLTKNSGDLLIAIIVCYQSSLSSAIFSSWGASFTELKDSGVASQHCVGIAYKWSDGTESGTFTVAQAGTITGHAAMILLSIPGAHASTAPEVGTLVTGTGSLSPGVMDPAGWAAEDTLWIAVAGSGETATTGSYTGIASAPTSYTDYADTGISGDVVGGVEAAVSFRQLNASSEDIGAYSVDTSNARNMAIAIAVRPAPATQSIDLGLLDGAPALYAPTIAHEEVIDFVDATSVVATGSQTTLVVPVPAGVANDDLLLMAVYLTATTGTITSPAGWNVLYANDEAVSSSSSHSSLFWRIASSEPADYTITTTSGRSSGGMIAVRGINVSDPIDSSTNTPNTTADLTLVATTLTATAHEMLVYIGGGRLLPNGSGWTASTPSGMTEVEDASSTVASVSNSGISIDYQYVDAGSTGSRTSTITTASSVDWITYLVALNPGGGPAVLTIPLLDSSRALYAPTIAPAPWPITLGLLDASPALYAPTLTPTNTLSLGLLDAAPALYAPTLYQISYISLGLLDSGATLYAPTLTPTWLISLGLLDAGAALYAPTLVPGPAQITVPLLDAAPALYAPTIAPAPYPITLPLLDAGPALYAMSLTPTNTLILGLLDAGAALYAPTIAPAPVLVSLGLLDSSPALYAPTLSTVNLVSLGLLDSGAALYAPTLSTLNLITLGLLDSGPALYAPELVALGGLQTIDLGLLDAGAALYAPTLYQISYISLGLLDSGRALYAPIVTPTVTFALPLLDAAPALYAPSLSTLNTLILGLLDSGAALYAPTIEGLNPGLNIFLPLLDGGAVLYAPIIILEEHVAGDVLNLLPPFGRKKRYPWTYRGLRPQR